MENRNKFGLVLLVTLALIMLTTGVVLARELYHEITPFDSSNQDYENESYGWHPMGKFGRHSRFYKEYPLMRSAMLDALAEVSNLPEVDIEARVEDGEKLYSIAVDLGLDDEAFFELVADGRETYFAEAVEEGWLTEARYKWMLDRMSSNWEEFLEGYPCHRLENNYSSTNDWEQRGNSRHW